MNYSLFYSLFYYLIDMAQVASLVVVVKAVAHDELIGDVEAAVWDVQINLQIAGFYQQG